MKPRRPTLALTIAALVLTGAAIAASAQSRRKATPPPRQSAPQQTQAAPAPTPAPPQTQGAAAAAVTPAKKNARGDGEQPAPAATPVTAATPVPTPSPARLAAEEVRYSFEFSQPQFVVSRYVIEHDGSGRGKITFERKNQDGALTESIEISPAAYARIVAAWEALRFLDAEESYQADKQFPHLGTMRLWMRRGGRERKTEFNWTHNDHASALAHEYRALAEQQFFVFDMAVAREYQPSEAIKVLKRLEQLMSSRQVSDADQLTPLLRDLTTDERIPLIARNHATRLLKQIEKK